MPRHALRTCAIAFLAAFAILFVGLKLTVSADETADNPYLPREGMSLEDLQAFIERMQDAPVSIRNRSGHAEGIKVAAERILETEPKGGVRRFAVTSLFDALHHQADLEKNTDADKQLAELAAKYAADDDKSIAKAAAFFALEQRALKSDDLSQDDLQKLLDELKTALNGKELGEKHLRIASATVHAINRLTDDKVATKRLEEFGKLFAKSDHPELARYGGKLASQGGDAAKPAGDWIGKPMELAGTTADGIAFDIAEYKGKVVLVDFWATWCGPCRASLPGLKETYNKHRKQGFEVVGVTLDRDLDDLAEFLEKDKLPWVNVIGEDRGGKLSFPIAEKYGVRAIPTTFLVDKEGKIAGHNLHGEELEKAIEKLLEK